MSNAVGASHIASATASSNASQPSIFDVLAQESLMSGLPPALQHLTKFLASYYPTQLFPLHKNFDEFYALLDGLLQNYYLKKYGASFSENFYGMKRVLLRDGRSELDKWSRYKSLVCLVVVPYARKKMDRLYEHLKRELEMGGSRKHSSRAAQWRDMFVRAFVKSYPALQAAIEIWSLLLQISYLLSKSSVHSPFLWLAGAQLVNLTPADYAKFGSGQGPAWPSGQGFTAQLLYLVRAFPRLVLAALSKCLGIGLFFLQFLDWWYNQQQMPSLQSMTQQQPVPPAPQLVCNERTVTQLDPKSCPICRRQRQNDTVLSVSGYVFCYSCISSHLQRTKQCPVTKLPATNAQLIRLFNSRTIPFA